MGKLLVFARENRPESEQIDPKKEAKLVMFTGVRYERREADKDIKTGTESKRKNGS